jgi:hypothetical protein
MLRPERSDGLSRWQAANSSSGARISSIKRAERRILHSFIFGGRHQVRRLDGHQNGAAYNPLGFVRRRVQRPWHYRSESGSSLGFVQLALGLGSRIADLLHRGCGRGGRRTTTSRLVCRDGYRPVGAPPGGTARLDMTARRPGRTGSRARLRREPLPRVPQGGTVAPCGSRLRLT